MLPVVCAVLATPDTCIGAVGDVITALRSLSPAKLSADTWYAYVRPPVRPLTLHDVDTKSPLFSRLSYATTSTAPPAPSSRYTL
jgi:hypothetical protein